MTDPSTEALKRVKDATRRTRASYVEGTPEKYPMTPLGGARLTDVERLLSDFDALAARLSQAEDLREPVLELAGYVRAHLAGQDADPELKWALEQADAALTASSAGESP